MGAIAQGHERAAEREPSTVPATFTRPRVPKIVAESASCTQVQESPLRTLPKATVRCRCREARSDRPSGLLRRRSSRRHRHGSMTSAAVGSHRIGGQQLGREPERRAGRTSNRPSSGRMQPPIRAVRDAAVAGVSAGLLVKPPCPSTALPNAKFVRSTTPGDRGRRRHDRPRLWLASSIT